MRTLCSSGTVCGMKNPFGRKLSDDARDRGTASYAVHQSLFMALKKVGYEGSAASSIAWILIKAVRPAMNGHASARVTLREQAADELRDIRGAVGAAAARESVQRSPARAELVRDIYALLGDVEARGPVVKLGAPAVKARRVRRLTTEEQIAQDKRRSEEIARLEATGMAFEEAAERAHELFPHREEIAEDGEDGSLERIAERLQEAGE